MKIQWNKVTWYSKAIALGVFVGLIILAFWFGLGYGELIGSISGREGAISAISSSPAGSGATASTGSDYYANPAEWQSYADTNGGYTISYPIDFATDENYSPKLSTDWQMLGGSTSGMLGFTLTIPSSFEPQTNFADAKLTVGWSENTAAVSQCLNPSIGSQNGATSTIMINGTTFTVFHASDAGAGNLYDTTSYRTLHGGNCYAIEYTVHSSQIANYPTSYNLQPFNEKMVTDLLDRIVGTVKFQ